jgi:hypothetical protein
VALGGVRAKGPLLAAPSAAAHSVTSSTPWATALDVYFFAKFVPDHIFLQNRDKINIKKFLSGRDDRWVSRGGRAGWQSFKVPSAGRGPHSAALESSRLQSPPPSSPNSGREGGSGGEPSLHGNRLHSAAPTVPYGDAGADETRGHAAAAEAEAETPATV